MTDTEYNVGDLLEATRDESVIRGRVVGTEEFTMLDGANLELRWLTRNGYTLTVIEKAASPLPSEPGCYLDRQGDVWQITDRQLVCLEVPAAIASAFAPFTRLEPVADTARKVLADVARFAWADGFTGNLNTIAAKYGANE